MLEIGSKAPYFELKDQNGKIHKLSDYLGKKIILYFYPKDNTPGCSKQAIGFSELYQDFYDKNAVVIGISKDSVKSHKKFEENNNLKIILLSDTEAKTIQDYDVWKEKKNFGLKYMGIERSTYIIDEHGIIIKAFSKVKANENPSKMFGEV